MVIIKSIFTDPGSLFVDITTLLMALIALIIVFLYDCSQEYRLKLSFLSSKSVVVRHAAVVLLICYIIGFGVFNSGSFIYFQF